jgi:hypothetical protein
MMKSYKQLYYGMLVIILLVVSNEAYVYAQEHGGTAERYLAPRSYEKALNDENLYHWDILSERLTREMPLWQKLSIGPYLIEALLSDDVYPSANADQISDKHHLSSVTGRAAFMLESIYGLNIPAVPRSITPDHRMRIHVAAAAQYAAYRNGVMEAVEEYNVGYDASYLLTKYRSALQKSHPDQDDHRLNVKQHDMFAMLLKEMMPIGKDLEYLERIVGRKARKVMPTGASQNESVDGVIYEYSITGGRFGMSYYMHVQDGVITQVNFVSS